MGIYTCFLPYEPIYEDYEIMSLIGQIITLYAAVLPSWVVVAAVAVLSVLVIIAVIKVISFVLDAVPFL